MKRRNIYWPINAVLCQALKHKKRNNNLWLFGAWRGRKFDDNSRYLFEYVNENCKNIDAVWLSDRVSVVEQVRSLGYKAELWGSREGKRLQLSAGIVFYTNGIDDLGNVLYVHGAKMIALWHGTGFKRIFNSNIDYQGIKRWAKRTKDAIFDFTYRDVSISTSDVASAWLKDCFDLEDKDIYITGLPRNDAFRKEFIKRDVLKTINEADRYKYILYMPTHRPYEDTTILDTVQELSKNSALLKKLDEENYKVVLKLHPLTNLSSLVLPEQLVVLADSDISSVQELMAVADVLVTDYSSAIIDFAIQNKPTVFYTPDYQRYCEKIGVGKDIEKLYAIFAISNMKELIEIILNSIDNPAQNLALTNAVNAVYESPNIVNSCYCKNVIELIDSLYSVRA